MMKFLINLILGYILCGLCLLLIASITEHGDLNAILMYLIVYFSPILVAGFLNAFLLWLLDKYSKNFMQKLNVTVIVPVLALVCFMYGDYFLKFSGKIVIFGIGITNICWLIWNSKNSSATG